MAFDSSRRVSTKSLSINLYGQNHGVSSSVSHTRVGGGGGGGRDEPQMSEVFLSFVF